MKISLATVFLFITNLCLALAVGSVIVDHGNDISMIWDAIHTKRCPHCGETLFDEDTSSGTDAIGE